MHVPSNPLEKSCAATLWIFQGLENSGIHATVCAWANKLVAVPDARNANINDMQNGWPTGRTGGELQSRWLHSDIRNMAYLYTYRLFEELITKGGLE